MNIKDAANILVTDNTHAATDYFKTKMKPELMAAFRPIADSTIKTEGAASEWSNLVSVYNKIPFIGKPLETNLTDFISARAIDAMFITVANEEENIRSKYEFRKTDMMKKVFGYAEEELKRRSQQPKWTYLEQTKNPPEKIRREYGFNQKPGWLVFRQFLFFKRHCAFYQYGYFIVKHFHKSALDVKVKEMILLIL